MTYSIGFCGSRELSLAHVPTVAAVVKQALSVGKIVTGCAVGADELVVRTVLMSTPLPLSDKLTVFTILEQTGSGGWKATARETVLEAGARGTHIEWNAGGDKTVSLRMRLRCRTIKMIEFLSRCRPSSGLIAFWTNSPGTRMSMTEATKAGIPVVGYPLENHVLPGLGAGNWIAREHLFRTGDPRKESFVWKPAEVRS